MLPISTRRRFLAVSSAAITSALAPVRLLSQALTARRGAPLFSNATLGAYQQNELSFARLQAVVGSTFHAFLDDDSVAELTLVNVSETGPTASRTSPVAPTPAPVSTGRVRARGTVDSMVSAGRTTVAVEDSSPAARVAVPKCFIAQFSSGATVVPQGSYVLDHGTLGNFSVLLVSSGKVPGVATCSATFNYL